MAALRTFGSEEFLVLEEYIIAVHQIDAVRRKRSNAEFAISIHFGLGKRVTLRGEEAEAAWNLLAQPNN